MGTKREAPAEEGDEGQQVGGHGMQVQGSLRVQYIVGEQIVLQHQLPSMVTIKHIKCAERHLQKRGTRGSRLAGTGCRSRAASAYSTSLVKRSCCSTVTPSMSVFSDGTVVARLGMSSRARLGTQASASAVSGVSYSTHVWFSSGFAFSTV